MLENLLLKWERAISYSQPRKHIFFFYGINLFGILFWQNGSTGLLQTWKNIMEMADKVEFKLFRISNFWAIHINLVF